jgi:hypothetical protein
MKKLLFFCLILSFFLLGCSINKESGAYCITKANDSNCYQLEDFTCDELCELRGSYNGSFVDFVPLIQSPRHEKKYLIPDYKTKKFCGDLKGVGCAKDCQEQTKLMSTDEKPVLGNCCCY